MTNEPHLSPSHIDRNLSLDELASVVRLSRFHFVRAFKKTAGLPPHQFVLSCRVERARRHILMAATGPNAAIETITASAELIPGLHPSRILPPSRPAEGSISRRSCIEGGLQCRVHAA